MKSLRYRYGVSISSSNPMVFSIRLSYMHISSVSSFFCVSDIGLKSCPSAITILKTLCTLTCELGFMVVKQEIAEFELEILVLAGHVQGGATDDLLLIVEETLLQKEGLGVHNCLRDYV